MKYAKEISNSLNGQVKRGKDQVFKIRIEAIVDGLGIPRTEFYEVAKVSRQYWYRVSWAIDPFPHWLKLHLFRKFGDCFAFLFDEELEGKE